MIYFASDVHLGAPYIADQRAHEARFVSWLQSIRHDASELFLLGDVFDYWFEYSSVVPRGFVRTLGSLACLADAGVKIHFFAGNHDAWVGKYLVEQLGASIHVGDYEFLANGKHFRVGHGDNLGYDKLYAAMMWCFHNPLLQWLYKWIHPDLANLIATTWSRNSRLSNNRHADRFGDIDPERENQLRFARQQLANGCKADFYVYGHRHRLLDHPLLPADPDSPRLLIIGDWIRHFSFASFDGVNLKLCIYEQGANQTYAD